VDAFYAWYGELPNLNWHQHLCRRHHTVNAGAADCEPSNQAALEPQRQPAGDAGLVAGRPVSHKDDTALGPDNLKVTSATSTNNYWSYGAYAKGKKSAEVAAPAGQPADAKPPARGNQAGAAPAPSPPCCLLASFPAQPLSQGVVGLVPLQLGFHVGGVVGAGGAATSPTSSPWRTRRSSKVIGRGRGRDFEIVAARGRVALCAETGRPATRPASRRADVEVPMRLIGMVRQSGAPALTVVSAA